MNSLRSSLVSAIAIALVSMAAHAEVPALNSYPTARATVYLDFDGQYIQGTIWNRKGPINALPAGLSISDITLIFNRVAADFQSFNLNVTTDSGVFNKAPLQQRIRVIITPTSSWYPSAAGGLSGVGSFTWGDDTPAWVFCDLLGRNTRFIADAASHEIGHALGLEHQSLYDNMGNKIAEYNGGEGSGEAGWAPIMGVGYYKSHTGWLIGASTLGYDNTQNDEEVIAGSPNNFGFRRNSLQIDNATNLAVTLFANLQNGLHDLNWRFSASDSIDHFEIEWARDGIHFQTLVKLAVNDHNFSYHPDGQDILSYRIKTVLTNNQESNYYSNTVTLKATISEANIRILNNPIGDLLTVTCNGNFSYQLVDVAGRIISTGQLHIGINSLPTQIAPKGLLFLHWGNPAIQGIEKLIKQ
jgi:hypothetical protein